MSLRSLTVAAMVAASLPAQPNPRETAPEHAAARAIFLALCATCHGPEGKGDGPVRPNPPPRDLTSGKFSFGNTEDAVFNTISGGIPPNMPPFDGTLAEEQRHALARYVLSLAPAPAATPAGASTLTVANQAVVVRGYLPPRRPGDDAVPRGLAIGLPGGVSGWFDADDLRLLEVRRGAFADRTDWRGRGGTPLQPLGDALLDFGIDPEPAFTTDDGPLQARLRETAVAGATVTACTKGWDSPSSTT